MAKLKCSTSFLHIFSTFSSNFLQIFQMSRTQTVSFTRRRMFESTLGRARLFTPMNSSCAKNTWISCTASASTKETASAVWHTNVFILSGYKGIWCQVSFLQLPQKEMPRQPERKPSGETVSTRTAWNKRLTSSENTALRELILHPPWTQTYSLRMFSIGS